jgi:hypothetical protein
VAYGRRGTRMLAEGDRASRQTIGSPQPRDRITWPAPTTEPRGRRARTRARSASTTPRFPMLPMSPLSSATGMNSLEGEELKYNILSGVAGLRPMRHRVKLRRAAVRRPAYALKLGSVERAPVSLTPKSPGCALPGTLRPVFRAASRSRGHGRKRFASQAHVRRRQEDFKRRWMRV